MRTRLAAVLLPLTFSLALAAYAQTQTEMSGNASHQKKRRMTLVGCLQTGSEPNTFILKNVSMSRSRSSGTPREMAKTETAYVLIPEENVDLKSHVGHKVEVSGMPMHENDSMGSAHESTESSPSYSEEGETPALRVSSIKHLSTTCP